MSKEGQSFDPWSEGNDLIQLIRETIDRNTLSEANDNQSILISKFLHDIKAVLSFGYQDNSQPLTDILIEATSLFVYSLRNDIAPLFKELVIIFDENNSFYVNNANYQHPSIKWVQVIEAFLQKDSIEQINERLSRNDKYLTDSHFLSIVQVLNSLKSYLTKTEGGVERLRNALTPIIRYFASFVSSRNFDESFLNIYKLLFNIIQSCPVLYSENKDHSKACASDLLEGFTQTIAVFIQIATNSNKSYLFNFCLDQILELLSIDLARSLLVLENFSSVLLSSLDSCENEQIEKLMPLFKLYAQNGIFTNPSVLNLLYSRGFISIITDCLQYIDFSVISQFSHNLELNQENINLLLSIASSFTSINTSRVADREVSEFVTSIIKKVIYYGLENDNNHDAVFNGILSTLSSATATNDSYFIKSLFKESISLVVDDARNQYHSSLPIEIMTQLFSDASIPEDSIDFDFVIHQLFESQGNEKQRESWLKLVDMILASTNLYITDSQFQSNNIHFTLEEENNLWPILDHLIEIHGLEAFDKSALGVIIDYLEELQNGDHQNKSINQYFVQFARNFIVCQNVQTKKIEMQTMSDKRIKTKTHQKFINPQFVVKMAPLDYDYLLFNLIEAESNVVSESQEALVSLYEKVDPTRISDVIDMFQNRLQNTSFESNSEQCDNSFAAVLSSMLDFSKRVEKESDVLPGILGFTRHSQVEIEEDYPLQIFINDRKNQPFPVNCNLETTISELKAIIAAKIKVRAEPLFLYHETQWLQDTYHVSDYNIASNTCLVLSGKFQPMPQTNYPTIILADRNFASYLLDSIDSRSTPAKRKSVMEFLNYLPTEENVAKVTENGYYFIAMIRNAETIEHLRYIIDTACSRADDAEVIDNFIQCNVLNSLYADMNHNKFGIEGVEVYLQFFLKFNKSLSLPSVLSGFIPSLLTVFSIEDGEDQLYQLTTSLLCDLLQGYPEETTNISLSNMHLLADAVRKAPPTGFDDLKGFICNLNDKLSVKLFAMAYQNEPRFEEIVQELFSYNTRIDDNSIEMIEKYLFVLEQLDEEPFKSLFNEFTNKLSRNNIDRFQQITENLLKIAQRTKSDEIRKVIFKQVAEFAAQSQTAKLLISDFSKETSAVSDYSNSFNVSQLDFQQSDINSKVLISDRDDISSIIQVLFHTFPFNYYMLIEKSFNNEAMWKLQYLFKQMVLLYKQSIDSTEVTDQFLSLFSAQYDINSYHDPIHFFQHLSNILPDHMRSVFEGVLHITIEGDDTDFITESDENFSLITLPILGFKKLEEALVYFFEHTDHYVSETQYYNQDYDELIDAHKTIKFEKLPPVLVLQLERYYNNGVVYNDAIDVPSELNVTKICSENLLLEEEEREDAYSRYLNEKNKNHLYNLTGAIVRDSITHKFRTLSKIDNKWFSYDSVNSNSTTRVNHSHNNACILDDESVISNSYVLFYTLENARLPGIVNDIETDLELAHPFDLSQYIDQPTKEYLDNLNFKFDQQRCAFSAPTMNFMVEHTTPIDYLRYFFNVLCHSIQHDEVTVGANHIINDIIEKIPPNENNNYNHKTMLNSVSIPSTFIEPPSMSSSLNNNNNNHRHEMNGNSLLEYVQSDFENIVSSLTHSHFHQLISDIIVLILERTGDDQSFNFIKRCVDQIKDKQDYDQTSPLSRLILKYILISDNNQIRALDADWTQELIWYLYSVFDFSRSYEFLERLDFSNLFNVLSILISKDHRPNDLYNLLKIKDQVLISPRHRHSFIAFLIKLDTSDILNSDFRNQTFSKAINDFERNLEGVSEQPSIPNDINLPDFFTELRRQIETGDETLRTNILNNFNSKLVPYLGNPDPEVRNSAKLLYYSVHENTTKDKNDLSIVQLLVNIGSAQECSTIIEVVNTLIKRNDLHDEKYITFLFDNAGSMKSSLCSSTSLILSVFSQYSMDVIERNLKEIIERVSGDYEELIDFMLQRFPSETIARTLDLHQWNEILPKIDNDHHISLIQKLLPLVPQDSHNIGEDNRLITNFITESILKDTTLTLMNSFLSSTINLFDSPTNFSKLLRLVDYTVRRANETMSNTNECQYFQRSLIKVSDIIVQNANPEVIRRGRDDINVLSRSSSSSLSTNNNNNNSQPNSPSSSMSIGSNTDLKIDNTLLFFNNFWNELCSDRFLQLILLVCKYDNDFEDKMVRAIEDRMDVRIEHFEKDKWFLAIICSQIVLNHENDEGVEEIVNKLKSIYDQSIKQHSRKERSRPDEIFDFYLKQRNAQPNQQDARWIVALAQRLLPEAHFLSDEERRFYEQIFSNYHDIPENSQELDEIVENLIHPPTENLAPVGGLDLQRSTLLARQREGREAPDVKKKITDNYGMKRDEAMKLANQDWFLEKFVSYLYGEIESAPLNLESYEDEDEFVSVQSLEEEPLYAKDRGVMTLTPDQDHQEKLMERKREFERQEELRRQKAQIEAQQRRQEQERLERERQEQERIRAEQERQEQERIREEQERIKAEEERLRAEEERLKAENEKKEQERQEQERIKAEQERLKAEEAKLKEEEERLKAEQERQEQERREQEKAQQEANEQKVAPPEDLLNQGIVSRDINLELPEQPEVTEEEEEVEQEELAKTGDEHVGGQNEEIPFANEKPHVNPINKEAWDEATRNIEPYDNKEDFEKSPRSTRSTHKPNLPPSPRNKQRAIPDIEDEFYDPETLKTKGSEEQPQIIEEEEDQEQPQTEEEKQRHDKAMKEIEESMKRDQEENNNLPDKIVIDGLEFTNIRVRDISLELPEVTEEEEEVEQEELAKTGDEHVGGQNEVSHNKG